MYGEESRRNRRVAVSVVVHDDANEARSKVKGAWGRGKWLGGVWAREESGEHGCVYGDVWEHVG